MLQSLKQPHSPFCQSDIVIYFSKESREDKVAAAERYQDHTILALAAMRMCYIKTKGAVYARAVFLGLRMRIHNNYYSTAIRKLLYIPLQHSKSLQTIKHFKVLFVDVKWSNWQDRW